MNKYENRGGSLDLGGCKYSPDLSGESTYIDSVGNLPTGDYVFVVQCVGFHIHERHVSVTIKETVY